jgi:transcriptional regulator with XRE-family HTH domain
MSNSEIFGQRLSAERKRLGLSQARLGDLLGMGRSMVSTIESGNSSLDTARLIGLQEHDFDLNFLVTGARVGEIAAKNMNWEFALSVDQTIRNWAQLRGLDLSVEKRALILKHFVQKAATGPSSEHDLEELLRMAA